MENRLTARDKNKNSAYYPQCFRECDGMMLKDCKKCDVPDEACNRLAAYEDIGTTDEFAALKKAEQEGRMIILPICKDCGLVQAYRMRYYECDRCGSKNLDVFKAQPRERREGE